MSRRKDFRGRSEVTLENGQEAVLYDPTEAVEEHAAAQRPTKRIGGLEVDEGKALPQDEKGRTEANSSGLVIAVPKRGQEEIFAHLEFHTALPVSADYMGEALEHARRHLSRMGKGPDAFFSFNITTHYYQAPLGKRECGWSFSFETNPYGYGSVSH